MEDKEIKLLEDNVISFSKRLKEKLKDKIDLQLEKCPNDDYLNRIDLERYHSNILDNNIIEDSFKRMIPYFVITIYSNEIKITKNDSESKKGLKEKITKELFKLRKSLRSEFIEKNIPIEIYVKKVKDNNKQSIKNVDFKIDFLKIREIVENEQNIEWKLNEIEKILKEKYEYNRFDIDERKNDISILLEMYKEEKKKNGPLIFFNDLFWIANSNQNEFVKTLSKESNKEELNKYIKNIIDLYIEKYKLKMIFVSDIDAANFIIKALADDKDAADKNCEMQYGNVKIVFSGYLGNGRMDKFYKQRLKKQINTIWNDIMNKQYIT